MKSIYVFTVFIAVFALAQAESDVDKVKQAFDGTEKFMKDNFGKLFDKLQEFIKIVEKDSKPFSDDIKKSVETMVKHINETIKNFNTPELQGKVKNVQETIHTSAKKVGEQLNELAKSAGIAPSPSIQKILNEIVDELTKDSQKFSDKMQQIISEVQAEAKKKKPAA